MKIIYNELPKNKFFDLEKMSRIQIWFEYYSYRFMFVIYRLINLFGKNTKINNEYEVFVNENI